ncbi:hypothetical protein [Antrihabitans cavernicola]|uniref:Uncharacterized protein n=1 Tax=Antrihabitans cavernicola TaxID=2495913 RepID=A0A5A7SG66_9NOCA|nr:hypothetical protein [Spelaeibacter cavernicola]KAA0024439.1 hypothetical protein FOY51_00250 [Spelaeibacter cavernicola]
MAIDLFVAGDPQSCYSCGTGLSAYATGIDGGSHAISDAKTKSEREWEGDAGNKFRGRIATMSKGADGLADQARAAGKAIDALGDGLTNAKAQMRQAANMAAEAGLAVTPDLCNPEMIAEPQRILGPMTMPQEVRYANQVRAYNEALLATITARDIEKKAHAALADALKVVGTVVEDAKSQLKFLVLGETTGVIGTAIGQSDKWAAVGEENRAKAAKFRAIAQEAIDSGDPFWESKALSPVRFYEGQADDAAKVVAANTKLAGGDGLIGKALRPLEWNPGSLAPEGTALRAAGSKLPVVGLALTAWQTEEDLNKAQDGGQVAKAIGKNVGGYAAGTAVTELILASTAGGPATFLAVTAGVGVAFGVGEVVDHWGPITRWMAHPW